MSKLILIIGIIAVLLAVALFTLVSRGPDLSMYDQLTEPRITAIEDQKMLVVEVPGDPNVAGERAFGKLFEVYYKLQGVPKGPSQPAPRARWPQSLDAPKEEWIGQYAMPVPANIETLPEHETGVNLQVKLMMWEYGEVAEILHIGPYGKEEPTIKKLKKFIEDEGYEIIGPHEEEYLRGPGMFFKVDPEDYYTIIRYRVAKSPSEPH